MLVMGGIIGSGIFMNPHVVAEIVHTPGLILGAWFAGGAIAVLGAFIYAELAGYTPEAGGQYVYLRESFHPLIAFLFGWSLFLVSNSGGMAAVAFTFARYSLELTGADLPESLVAVVTILVLTAVNCFGVRSGTTLQNILMVMKILAIIFLILFGYALVKPAVTPAGVPSAAEFSADSLTAFGAALVPVMFAFGGWQTANFIAGEIREPEKNLARGLLLGVAGVLVLYAGVNIVCLRALGTAGLAASRTPATEVMALAFGRSGAHLIAIGIAVSTLGFLSQSVLTAPRVYFAMAQDGLFFRRVAALHPVSRVPVFAIILQGLFAMLVALSGTYEQILSYVVSDDFIFFGLTGASLFILRKRFPGVARFRTPGHPWTTALFVIVCICIVANTVYYYPVNTLIGIVIMILGIPVFYYWRRQIPQHTTI